MTQLVKAIATTAKVGDMCTADIAGVITSIWVIAEVSVSIGDALLVGKWGSTWFAIGHAVTTAPGTPADPPPDPPSPSPPQTGKLVVSPVSTGSYRDSKWRTDNDDVYQGEYGGNGNHVGAVFYGSKPRSLDGATVTKATIRVRRPDRGGANAAQSTTLWLVTQSTKPSGAPTRTSSTSGPSLRRGQTNDTFTVPTSWVQDMVDGTAGGLAIYESDGSPYVILSGRGDWSAAFTLTIYWSRS